MNIRVKICCIQNEREAQSAITCGAHAIGLVGEMPSGPGPISDRTIARIAAAVPPHAMSRHRQSASRAEVLETFMWCSVLCSGRKGWNLEESQGRSSGSN